MQFLWKDLMTGSMIRHSKSAFAIYQSSLGDLRAIFVLGLWEIIVCIGLPTTLLDHSTPTQKRFLQRLHMRVFEAIHLFQVIIEIHFYCMNFTLMQVHDLPPVSLHVMGLHPTWLWSKAHVVTVEHMAQMKTWATSTKWSHTLLNCSTHQT